MKRILMIGMIWAVSMFFTGCTTLSGSYGKSYMEIKKEVEAESSAAASEESWPEYYEENEKEKKEEAASAKRAFKIKDGHSSDLNKIVSFEVETMLSDGTFIYGYSTPLTNNEDQIVHCVASYNYSTKAFKVLYEKTFSRSNIAAEEECFYFQICKDKTDNSQRLFVYDNGKGYLCDMNCQIKFSADIEETLDTFYNAKKSANKIHDVSVSNVWSDGGERLYVEVSIEKEELKEPASTSTGSSEEDEEIEGSIRELILVYDFRELESDSIIYQVNQNNTNALINQWKNMYKKKVFMSYNSIPSAESDWKKICGGTANKWSTAVLTGIETDKNAESLLKNGNIDYSAVKGKGIPMLVWKGDPVFDDADADNSYVCSFNPNKNAYQAFIDVKENTELSKVFIPQYGKYYEVHGTTGTVGYDTTTVSRTYQYYTWEPTQSGQLKLKKNTATQTLTIYTARRISIQYNKNNGYLEGYGTLDSLGISGLVGVYDHKMLCQKMNGKNQNFYWLTDDWKLKGTKLSASEDENVEMTVLDNSLYYIISSEDKQILKKAELDGGNWKTEKKLEVNNSVLDIDGMDIQKTQSGNREDITAAIKNLETNYNYDTWDHVLDGQILKTSIKSDSTTINKLKAAGIKTDDYKVDGDGFLFTKSGNGLVFYSTGKKKAVNLDSGTWYKTWKKSNGKLVSIGFSKDDTYHNTNTVDLAYATVFEYSLNDLYKSALEALLKKAETKNEKTAEEKQEKIKESIEASNAAAENKETVEDMQKMWEKVQATRETIDLESLANEASTAATGKTSK